MKKVLKKLSRFIVSFFAIFSILFTMSIIIFAAISQYVYEDVSFIRELIAITGILSLIHI